MFPDGQMDGRPDLKFLQTLIKRLRDLMAKERRYANLRFWYRAGVVSRNQGEGYVWDPRKDPSPFGLGGFPNSLIQSR